MPFPLDLLHAVPQGRPHLPPLWKEGRMGLETLSLLRDPVWRGQGVPRGGGRPVLLIPGFLAGDGSLALMTRWLRDLGYRTKCAGIRFNVDCSEAACVRIEERLEALAARFGPVAIVGQSRGGLYARAIAVHRPDLVAGIVTLGSPLRSPFAVHPVVLAQVGVMGALGMTGLVQGTLKPSCLRGECCDRYRTAMLAGFPEDVGFVSVYSRSDGIVNWRACLDPWADEHVEVRASHCGMSLNAEAYRVVGRVLGEFGELGEGAPAARDDLAAIPWAQAA